ncbi:ECF RNA polymerase sigma factor SigW [compost metagenome]
MDKLIFKSDDDLLLLLQSGDHPAFEVIYNRYWQLLFRFARKMLQDENVAKDVVQDVFTTLWVKNAETTIHPPLAAYLYKLTRNKILDFVKHTKVEDKYLQSLNHFLQQSEALPDRLYIEKELYDQIEQEIKNLPDKMRTIFEMSRKDYKSTSEIAEELNISNKTVKNQISAAKNILKGKLGDTLNTFLLFF